MCLVTMCCRCCIFVNQLSLLRSQHRQRKDNDDRKDPLHLLNSENNYITLFRSMLDRTQADFLQRRKPVVSSTSHRVGETEFHRWLTITRLLAREIGRLRMADVVDWISSVGTR
jgi:hypothetical protein